MMEETSDAKVAQLTAKEVLDVLSPEASPELRAAIASGGCIHYYVAEGQCVAGGCGAGKCCYHVVGAGIDTYECLGYPCSKGNFSTGC
jgi:hypothetical protein